MIEDNEWLVGEGKALDPGKVGGFDKSMQGWGKSVSWFSFI